MRLTGTQKLLMSLLVVVALFAGGPLASGYALVVASLPIYGAACHLDRIFGRQITPDGYRVFLLGLGCDVDAAIRRIVVASEAGVDPARIIAIYHGAERPESPNELLLIDVVRNSLKDFARSEHRGEDCPPGQYCRIPDLSRGITENLIETYLSSARSQFLAAVDDGADYISWLLRLGAVVQGIVSLVYVMLIFTVGKIATHLIIRFIGKPVTY